MKEEIIIPIHQLPLEEGPVEYWDTWIWALTANKTSLIKSGMKNFLEVVNALQETSNWKRYADTWEDFCRKYYDASPEWVEQIRKTVDTLKCPVSSFRDELGEDPSLAAQYLLDVYGASFCRALINKLQAKLSIAKG